MLSEKIRGLLSTWMAGYARGLVNECADEATKLERVARAAKELNEIARKPHSQDVAGYDESGHPLNNLGMARKELDEALKEVEHLLGVDK